MENEIYNLISIGAQNLLIDMEEHFDTPSNKAYAAEFCSNGNNPWSPFHIAELVDNDLVTIASSSIEMPTLRSLKDDDINDEPKDYNGVAYLYLTEKACEALNVAYRVAPKMMTQEDVDAIMAIEYEEPVISADELTDKTPRTLLFGYNANTGDERGTPTFHIYLCEKGLINKVVYFNQSKEVVSKFTAPSIDVEKSRPTGSAYPEACDPEFCKLLAKRHSSGLRFHSLNKSRQPAHFYGMTEDELFEYSFKEDEEILNSIF